MRRSPIRIVLARYVNTGEGTSPSADAASTVACSSDSWTIPPVLPTLTCLLSAVVATTTPRSSSRITSRSESTPIGSPPAASSIVFARSPACRSRCRRRRGAKIARTSPCCGRRENSPRSSRESGASSVSRIVRATSSFCENSDSRGIAEGFCNRVNKTSPDSAFNSSANAGDTNTPFRAVWP